MEGDDDVQELTDIETGNDDDIASNNDDGDADGTAAFVPTNCTSFELGHAYSAVTAMEPVYTRVPLHAVIGHTQPEWLVKQSVVSAAEIQHYYTPMILLRWASRFSKLIRLSFNVVRALYALPGTTGPLPWPTWGFWIRPLQRGIHRHRRTQPSFRTQRVTAEVPALVTDHDEDVNTAQVKSKRININNRDEVRANQRSGKDSNIPQEPTIRKIDGNR
jgi:hypothetical protein